MSITEYGLEEVKMCYERALANLAIAQSNLTKSLSVVTRAKKQLDCEHKDLDYSFSYMFNTTTCKTCNYIWDD